MGDVLEEAGCGKGSGVRGMKLKDLGDYFIGLTYKPESVTKEGTIVLRSGNIQGGKLDLSDIIRVNTNIREKQYVRPGDILMCSRNGSAKLVGKSTLIPDIDEPMTFGAFMTVFRTPYNEYLRFFFRSDSFRKQLLSSKTTTINQITINMLDNIDIDLPEKSTRDERCTILNRILKVIDAKEKQLSTLDNLIKARFVEMFGTIHDNKFAFRIMTIQDVCEPIKDGTHQTPEYTDVDENGFRFLSSKDVTSGRIDWNHLKFIPEKLHKELYSRIAPRKGDLLLAKNGTTGIAAIVDRDEVFDIYVSLALLRPTIVDSTYLWGAINSTETKEQFDASLKGIGVPNLHLGEIKKTRIIVPPIEKQQEFATFVTQINKSKSVIQKSLDETQLLFDSLMQKYFG